MPLPNPKHEQFCLEYIKDFNATQAVIRTGYSETGAKDRAVRLMREPGIQTRVAELIAERSAATKIDANKLLQQLWEVSNCDVNEIVRVRRVNCRCCYGIDFKHQRTNSEIEHDRRQHAELCNALEARGQSDKITAFDMLGGAGFVRNRDPNPACPECGGEGVSDTFIADTAKMPYGARMLYAGAKQTKDGIEVKFHSKEKYIEMLARHLSLFNDKLTITDNSIEDRLRAGRKRVSGK